MLRIVEDDLGKGVGSAMLEHIRQIARERGYAGLLLETGSGDAFHPAHRLYARYGFSFRGPFGDYKDDPFSRFTELSL